MKRICFLLPSAGGKPIGGFKVVYEYANGLTRRGYPVSVVHPAFFTPNHLPQFVLVAGRFLGYLKHLVMRSWRPNHWFNVDPRVDLLWLPVLSKPFVPDADVYVATWWLTAEWLTKWQTDARKFYLIQHLETWGGPEGRVMATWRAPLEKIVIAKWLADIAEGLDEKTAYIPNGLDFEKFSIDIPIEARDSMRVAMMYHNAAWKGSNDGIKSISLLKNKFPKLSAELFGVSKRPDDLPGWIEYHCNPEQSVLREIYNRAAVFLAPSWTEGWPLPPSEAMMAGAAVVATDIGGHREYCFDFDTALLVPPRDPVRLAEAAATLIENDTLRCRIARAGNANIRQFTWARALDAFEKVLNG